MTSGVVNVVKISLALIAVILAIIGTLVVFGLLNTEQAIDVSIKVVAVIGLFAGAFAIVSVLGKKEEWPAKKAKVS